MPSPSSLLPSSLLLGLALLAPGVLVPVVTAQDAADTAKTSAENAAAKAQLRLAFATREKDIAQFKGQGVLGETVEGLLAVPAGATAPAAAKSVMDAENEDRRALYRILAGETATTTELVAERNARRLFEAAKPGEWLRKRDGTWAKR